jgi:Tfp pilus assembly protein PilX
MYPSRFDSNDDWKRYPQNLRLAPLESEASRNDTRISRLSKDLFVANNESTFEIIAIGVGNNGKASSVMSQLECD